MKIISALFMLGTVMLISGCGPTIADYKDNTPKLAFEEFFNGPVLAHGIIQSRSGKVMRRFTVDMRGTWSGDKGTLEELFAYDDGERQERTWHVTRLADGRYTGTASDIIGTATGEQAGNAIRWNYVMRIPVDGKTYDVTFDDWMFLMPDGTMLNRSILTKFGFRVGEVSIYMEKKPE